MDIFDMKRRCPKCGGKKFNVRWHAAEEGGRDMLGYLHDPKPERIGRHCLRCEFCWTEAPMDSAKPLQPEAPQ